MLNWRTGILIVKTPETFYFNNFKTCQNVIENDEKSVWMQIFWDMASTFQQIIIFWKKKKLCPDCLHLTWGGSFKFVPNTAYFSAKILTFYKRICEKTQSETDVSKRNCKPAFNRGWYTEKNSRLPEQKWDKSSLVQYRADQTTRLGSASKYQSAEIQIPYRLLKLCRFYLNDTAG